MLSDIEIAQQAALLPIEDIAQKAGIPADALELYGRHKAKIALRAEKLSERKDGKLILVTAMTPTPAGEGKTTVSVGLADALSSLGEKTILALREPSLGPVFGVKGGAAGGGYAQVVPMEDINLHFTGDIHAVSAATNLLSALIDNHIFQSNALGLDSRRITWKHCVDINDRQLRHIVGGLGGRLHGVPREDGFDISVASEVMAVLCLSENLSDLKERLGRIVVGYTYDNEPVTAAQLHANGAMAALLKDAIKPNLVQTLEHTPTLIHGGPFANIAHGCSSVSATKLALKLADYVVTEAGFGADLGAEKFVDIKCRSAKLRPAACVIVATVRALKSHGGVPRAELSAENLSALERGLPNLIKHIENMTQVFGIPGVVALNRFESDTPAELALVSERLGALGIKTVSCEVWQHGGAGASALAREVLRVISEVRNDFRLAYEDTLPIREKIETLVRRVYGGEGVDFDPAALKALSDIEKHGFDKLPVCVAKTQYSFSDNPRLTCRPSGFRMHVSNLKVSAGAGFVVVFTGDIMTMPGLPKVPCAENIDVDENGVISGLF